MRTTSHSRRPGRRRILALCALLVAALLTPTAAAATGATTTTAPERQLSWLLEASSRVPVPAGEIRAHITPDLLEKIGGPEAFNATLTQFAPLHIDRVLKESGSAIKAAVRMPVVTLAVSIRTDSPGRIVGLIFQPYADIPASWSELDARLHALAPHVSFTASVLDPGQGCRVVHGVNGDTQRPLGSAFKLYVLGALGHAVATGAASWNQKLAIHDEWKSLPSGVLQNKPAGTKLTLRQYANYMISISDNTAADHLIHFLGRDTVKRQLSRFGNQDPGRTTPFPTTREMFTLKSVAYPYFANAYLATPRLLREPELRAADRIPRSRLSGWKQPRNIDSIEWFGSPDDMCRAYAGLWRQHHNPALAPIGAALSINRSSILLDEKRFPTVWFKGGAEPGVLTFTYLARTASGKILVTSVLLADPGHTFRTLPTELAALQIAHGGLALAAGPT